MTPQFTFPILLCLALALTSAGALRCYVCSSAVHGSCNPDPKSIVHGSTLCTKNAIGCYTLVQDDMYRGCAQLTDRHWQMCANLTVMGCFFCKTDHCNSHVLMREGTQKCVVCRGEECKTKNELETCSRFTYHNNPQWCHYSLQDSQVVQKGCGPSGAKGQVTTVCQGDGCNLELPLTYSACYEYHGGPEGYYTRRKLTQCHQEDSKYWHPGCYYTPPWLDRTIRSGCLSLLNHNLLKECTHRANKVHCQYCLGDQCNKMERQRINYTNVCETPVGVDFCSQLKSRCYVSQLWLNSSSSDGHYTTILQKYGGCVEAEHNSLLMASRQTHFCDNFHADQVPCLRLDDDFEKRLSCFQCKDCDDVFVLDYRAKHLCPVGTTHCYAVMSRDMTVRRGCFTPTDPLVQACYAFHHVCAKCDYSYCNFFQVGNPPASCYKTRPYMHNTHLMTMRMEPCTGRGLKNVWPNCYVARLSTPYIHAGCVNELQAEDIVRFTEIDMGDISIIDKDTLTCYKCTSNQTDFCYNVRHLEPETCGGQSQYAIRGCYTLLLKHSIQRGCLTELDLYHQRMCAYEHFLEICIACEGSYCNIHVP